MSGDVQVRFCERPRVRLPRATHLVIVFKTEEDARRVLDVLPKRFGKYGLRLHPEKTRLVRFVRPPRGPRPDKGDPDRPASFDMLGFTHYWGRSLKGNWVVKQRTASSRFSRALRRLAEWCRANRHLPVPQQHEILTKKLLGHDGYYGVIGNYPRLKALRHQVECIWFKWLRRRSWAGRRKNWEWMQRLLERFPLPKPRLRVHGRPAKA